MRPFTVPVAYLKLLRLKTTLSKNDRREEDHRSDLYGSVCVEHLDYRMFYRRKTCKSILKALVRMVLFVRMRMSLRYQDRISRYL